MAFGGDFVFSLRRPASASAETKMATSMERYCPSSNRALTQTRGNVQSSLPGPSTRVKEPQGYSRSAHPSYRRRGPISIQPPGDLSTNGHLPAYGSRRRRCTCIGVLQHTDLWRSSCLCRTPSLSQSSPPFAHERLASSRSPALQVETAPPQ